MKRYLENKNGDKVEIVEIEGMDFVIHSQKHYDGVNDMELIIPVIDGNVCTEVLVERFPNNNSSDYGDYNLIKKNEIGVQIVPLPSKLLKSFVIQEINEVYNLDLEVPKFLGK